MSDNVTITVVGNVGAEPSLRATRDGKSVLGFGLATARRRQDRETGEWTDGETEWYNVSVFGTLADHAAASLHRGQRVIVTGRLRIRRWETQNKEGISAELTADALGHDLLFGTTTFRREYAEARAPESGADSASTGDPWARQSDAGAEPGWSTPGQAPDASVVPDSARQAVGVSAGGGQDETPF